MNLVEITAAGHGVLFDLAYAGAGNFTGRPVYRRRACYLHVDAASLLGPTPSVWRRSRDCA